DDAGERGEVDLDVVVDVDVEVLLERVDDLLRAVVERRVDLRPTVPGDVDQQVTGERDEQARLGVRGDVDDHERVGQRRTGRGRSPEGLRLGRVVDEVPGVGPDDQVVAGLAGPGRQVEAPDPGDVVQARVDHLVRTHHAAGDQDEGHAEGDQVAPTEGAPRR